MGRVTVERLPVLTYHSLDDSGSPVSIAPAQFRQQMEWLRDHGWRTLTISEFLGGHVAGGWSPRSCLVTFDDGFANFADHAVPVLKACGFTATVFVVAGWVGRRNEWPDQPTWVPRQSLMDWQALRAIAREGMEIGGHTFTHPHLARLGVTSAAGEIADGKRAIEDQVAQYVRAFAYPYGEVTSALERIARDHFSVAFGTRLGYTASGSPLSAARRVDVYYLRSPRCFRQIGTDPLDLYLHARQQLRDLRQLGARPFALTGPRTGHHVTS